MKLYWEQRELSNLVTKLKSYPLSRNVETLTQTGTKYVHYGDIHTGIASKIGNDSFLPYIEAENYETLRNGDIILADASEDYQGIAEPAVITENTEFEIVSGLHTIALRPISTNSLYLYYLIKSPKFRKHGYRTGTGMKVFGITASNVLKFESNYPILEEQSLISEFINKMDYMISLHQRKINILKKQKKAYLNVIFPKNNENAPDLRFENFKEAWEQRKFKDFSKKSGIKNSKEKNFPAYSVSNRYGLVRQNSQFEGSRLENLEKSSYKIVYPNEFVYNPSRINVGSLGFNDLNKTLIVSSLYVIVKMQDDIDNGYIQQFMKSQFFNKEVNRNTEGSVREYLFFENFKDIRFPYTKNIKEQQRIGILLKKLDNTITLHQSKLDRLVKIKKVYLNKMFI